MSSFVRTWWREALVAAFATWALLLATWWVSQPRIVFAHPGGAITIRYKNFNRTAPGANSPIVGTAVQSTGGITPRDNGTFIVQAGLTNASVLNVTATDGSTEHKWGLDKSTALQAGDLYEWEFLVNKALRYDFEIETDGVVETIIVAEVKSK